MLCASLALCGLALTGMIGFLAGLLMFASLIGYIAWSYSQDKNKKASTEIVRHIEEDIEVELQFRPLGAWVFVLASLGLLIGGAYILVEGAVSIARGFGVSEAVIGLTIVAVGTSLPELATAVVAAYRKHSDVIIPQSARRL